MSVRKILLGTTFSLFAGHTTLAQSPVDSMTGYYDKAKKTHTSVTDAGVYKSQSRYAVTGGSYVWRAEQESVQLVNAQLPSITAGCGGIDIYAGSFSFINGEQLEALFRAILQNARGYAFHAAIKEISPEIEDSLTTLQNMMNKVNAQNINSCEAAEAIVSSAADVIKGRQRVSCAVKGAAHGIFPDALSGSVCGNEGDSSTSDDEGKKNGEETPTNQNYAMKATADSSFANDLDLREFYMSISGTLIHFAGAAEEYQFIKPIGLDDSVVGALMRGGTIQGYKCVPVTRNGAEYTRDDCFIVSEDNPITIPTDLGFLVRVQSTLGKIYDRAALDLPGEPSVEELAFVEDTPLPVLRAAQLFSIAYPESGREMLLSYSELISYNIALSFLEDVYQTVLEGAEGNVTADYKGLQVWKTQLQENKRDLVERQSKLQVRFSAVQAFVNQLHEVEGRVNADVSAGLLQAASRGGEQ